MGLDVTAYSRVSFVEILPDYDAWDEKYGDVGPRAIDTVFLSGEQDFPEHLAPIFVPQKGIAVYRVHSEKIGIRAGAYSYYNQ